MLGNHEQRAVLVEWRDSHAIAGWQELADIDAAPVRAWSMGWIVAETDDAIVLAPHLAEEGVPAQGNGMMVIPKGAVISTQEITSSSASSCPEPASGPTPKSS